MSGRLEGKVCVITGAASGIGAGTARMFVAHGAKVIVADMQADAGMALVAQLGDNARFALCNVTKEADVAAAVDLAVSEFGRLDVMFNNAGIVGAVGRISEMRPTAPTIPALLNITSSCPNSDTARSTAAATSASLVTLHIAKRA